MASWQLGPELVGSEIRIAPAAGASPVHRVPQAAVSLRRLIRKARPDVVHIHSLGAHGLLSLALPRGPARVVTPWGSELHAAQNSVGRAAIVRLAARRADLVLSTSSEFAAEMIERYRVLPGPDAGLFLGSRREPDRRTKLDLPRQRPGCLRHPRRRDRCALGPQCGCHIPDSGNRVGIRARRSRPTRAISCSAQRPPPGSGISAAGKRQLPGPAPGYGERLPRPGC